MSAFFAWISGWGGGPLNLFPAEEAVRISLSGELRAIEPADPEVSCHLEGQPVSRFGRSCRGPMEPVYALLKHAHPAETLP